MRIETKKESGFLRIKRSCGHRRLVPIGKKALLKVGTGERLLEERKAFKAEMRAVPRIEKGVDSGKRFLKEKKALIVETGKWFLKEKKALIAESGSSKRKRRCLWRLESCSSKRKRR